MLNILRTAILALILVAAVSGLGGCASPANREAMQAAPIASQHKSPHSVTVRTSGGGETGATGSSNIADDDFKAAIEASITQSGVFGRIVQGAGGDYELLVTVIQLSKPMMGFSMTVTMETAWTLIKSSDKSVVLRKAVQSTYTAGMGDAFAGVTRLRLAVEGAARDSISQGLNAISELKL